MKLMSHVVFLKHAEAVDKSECTKKDAASAEGNEPRFKTTVWGLVVGL